MDIKPTAIDSPIILFNELKRYPKIASRIDQQFKDCLLAPSLGCQVSRDILPFCGNVFTITKLAYKNRYKNPLLFNAWEDIFKKLYQGEGLKVERYGLPPTHLCFPLSKAVLEGKNLTFDKISFLDPKDSAEIEKVTKDVLRITEQAAGISVFSETSLKMMLKGKNTLFSYASTKEGSIGALLWGIKLLIKQQDTEASCFLILFAAREPEFCGQHIYEKMFAEFKPKLLEGYFKSDFFCWKQGKENTINNEAIKSILRDIFIIAADSENPYSFESATFCKAKLGSYSSTFPNEAQILDALNDYCLEVGDLWTFITEFPMLYLKNEYWKMRYDQTFPQPEGYPTSLQPFVKM